MNYQYLPIEPFSYKEFIFTEYCATCGKVVRSSNLKNEWKEPVFVEFCFECWGKLCITKMMTSESSQDDT